MQHAQPMNKTITVLFMTSMGQGVALELEGTFPGNSTLQRGTDPEISACAEAPEERMHMNDTLKTCPKFERSY